MASRVRDVDEHLTSALHPDLGDSEPATTEV